MRSRATTMTPGDWIVAGILLLAAFVLTGWLGTAIVAVAAAVFIAVRFAAR